MIKAKIVCSAFVLTASLALSACNGSNNNAQTAPSSNPPASQSASSSPSPSVSPSASAPTDVKKFDNFPTWGYDMQITRHVPFKEITADNVKDLGVVWHVDLKSLDKTIKNGNQAYPVVVDGVAYVSTSGDHVIAFNALTGGVIWHWKPDEQFAARIKDIPMVSNRGVAVGEGKVFLLSTDNQIVALDQKTGQLVKQVKISDFIPDVTTANGYYETTAPIYYNGTLFIGSSGGDNGARGFVAAYKASDLTPAWDSPFWTVPPRGQGWLKSNQYLGGGAVWNPAAIDPDTGIMYFSVGNPAPDFYGEVRPGSNPYTDSVVALDSKTGKLIWAKEEINHDQWDYDAAASPMIVQATVKGAKKKVVVEGGKSGQWWAWDAANGNVIYDGVPFAKISHPKPTPQGVLVYPGVLGGENYAPETYDPASNYVLIPSIESPSLLKKAKNVDEIGKNKGFFGAADMGTDFADSPNGIKPYGTITAIDMNTGKVVYKNKTDDPMRGGFTSTDTGLAFYGELSGKVNALDIKSGKVVWTFQTGGDNIGSAPSFFTADGKTFMIATTGGSKPQVYAFALGGDKTQGSAGQANNANPHQDNKNNKDNVDPKKK